MEHKIFRAIREKVKIPFFVRFILGVFLIFISVPPIILPIFPGSLFVGVFIAVVGLLFIVPGSKIRHIIKIRKGIVYLFQNIHRKRVVKHKMKDIKDHIKDILKEDSDDF